MVTLTATASMQTGITEARTGRDLGLDFWRGAAILMIFVNHIPDNVLSFFTTRTFGLSDAAEAFVFISGIAVASAFIRKCSERPVLAIGFASGRALSLYTVHIALFISVAAVCAFYRGLSGSDELMHRLLFGPFFFQTEEVLLRVATLTYLPVFMDIIPLYVVLSVMAGLLFAIFAQRWWAYLLAAIGLYVLARIFQWNLPAYPEGRDWFFNPFAWQILFFAGFAVAMIADRSWFKRALKARLLIGVSFTIAALGVVAAAPWTFHGMSDVRFFSHNFFVAEAKQNLSVLRIIHFMGIAHLVYLYGSLRTFRENFIVRMIASVGANALAMFFLATVMSMMAFGWLFHFGDHWSRQVLASSIGVVTLASVSLVTSSYRSALRDAGGKIAGMKKT
jgi:hypothetical protein